MKLLVDNYRAFIFTLCEIIIKTITITITIKITMTMTMTMTIMMLIMIMIVIIQRRFIVPTEWNCVSSAQ